jgi:hypothetical protein
MAHGSVSQAQGQLYLFTTTFKTRDGRTTIAGWPEAHMKLRVTGDIVSVPADRSRIPIPAAAFIKER